MLGMEKRIHALYGDEVGKEADNPKTVERETAGAARAGLALALLAILMAGAAYFGMDAKVSGLEQKIQAVAAVEARMAAVEERRRAPARGGPPGPGGRQGGADGPHGRTDRPHPDHAGAEGGHDRGHGKPDAPWGAGHQVTNRGGGRAAVPLSGETP